MHAYFKIHKHNLKEKHTCTYTFSLSSLPELLSLNTSRVHSRPQWHMMEKTPSVVSET